jgi:23S rRNA (adenine2503-C2)-methyltransferase
MNWKAVDVTPAAQPSAALGIGARHHHLDGGCVAGMRARRTTGAPVAISIHAPNDGLRRELDPINTKYPLADVIEAAKVFDRRVTFEYVALGGVNGRRACDSAAMLRGSVERCEFDSAHLGGAQGSCRGSPIEFAIREELRANGVESDSESRGKDIAAACGQLRVERLGRRTPRAANDDGDIQRDESARAVTLAGVKI